MSFIYPALVLLLSLPVLPGTAWAQPQPQAADTVAQAGGTLAALRDQVESRYQVLPLQNGIVLIPRVGTTDVQSIELADETIAVNGAVVTGAELRAFVPEDADAIVRLSFLDPGTRLVLFGLGASPAPPGASDTTAVEEGEEEEDDDGYMVSSSTQDQVRIGGSIHIRPGERVDGDVVAVGGSVRIDGYVTGEVVAVGGSVDLGPSAHVEGDVTAVGGRIHRADGSVVGGSFNEVAFGRGPIEFGGAWHAPAPFGGVSNVIGTVMWIVVLGILVSLALLLARRPIERMETRVRNSPWKAAAVGLAAQILFFPVLVLVVIVLAISIIGIPLLIAVPFAILALMVGTLLGFTAVCKAVGHGGESRFGWSHASPYVSALVGLGLIMAVSFFASAIGMGGGPLEVFAIILGILGFVIQYIVWTIGFGVLLLTRFGTRYRWGDEEPVAPAPEPPPVLA